MSCNNCNQCECISLDNINQCEDVLTFDLGILNAEKDLKFNITGRSKRIYQIDVTTDSDGIASVDLEPLPIGYISLHFPGVYKVWFTDQENQKVAIRDTEKSCFEFKAESITGVIASTVIPPATPDYSDKDTFNIEIVNKGNGDTITHGYGFRFRIVTFFDGLDNTRQKNIFFATNQSTTDFILNNDFDDDKYSGTLLCVKL